MCSAMSRWTLSASSQEILPKMSLKARMISLSSSLLVWQGDLHGGADLGAVAVGVERWLGHAVAVPQRLPSATEPDAGSRNFLPSFTAGA
jgi:hypothetical protein